MILSEKEGFSLILELIETLGQEEFREIIELTIRSGYAFVFCFSITSRASFEEVKSKGYLSL